MLNIKYTDRFFRTEATIEFHVLINHRLSHSPLYCNHTIKPIIVCVVRLIIITIYGSLHDAHSHKCCLISSERSRQQRAASGSSDSGLMTLVAFHGHIDFSPTLQIIAGCCESHPPRAAGRSFCSVLTRQRLSDLRNVISWDLIDCNWLFFTSCLCYQYI